VESFARALWTTRGIMAVLTVVPAALAAMLWWPAVVLAVLAVVLQVVAVLRLRGFVAAVRAGDRGEILFANGQRVPQEVFRGYLAVERLEHGVGVLALLAAVTGATVVGDAVVVGVCVVLGLLQLLILAMRYTTWRQQRAHEALMARRPQEALRILQPFKRVQGPAGDSIAMTRSSAMSRLGDEVAAERLLEDAWSGAYDGVGAMLALMRVGRGEAELARAWLDSFGSASHRYDRYLVALVRGHLAVHDGDLVDHLDELEEVAAQLPRFQGRELDLLRAAGLHLAGRSEDAAAVLSQIDHLDEESWRARTQPQLWAWVEQARAGRPVSRVPAAPAAARSGAGPRDPAPQGDPYAAPKGSGSGGGVPGGWRRRVGALPVESAVLVGQHSRVSSWLLRVLTLLVVVLSLPLALVWALPPAGEMEEVRQVVPPVLSLVACVVMLVGVREATQWLTMGHGRGIRLSDGRLLVAEGRRWWWLFSAQSWMALVLIMGLSVGEFAWRETAYSLWLVVPLVGLSWVGVRQHTKARQACEAVHFAPAGEVAAQVEPRVTHASLGWLLLAHLVDGDEEEARAFLVDHVAMATGIEELGLWVRAGRGETSLEQLLQRPTPTLGSRFRLAVAARLAALEAGRPQMLAAEVVQGRQLADELPNRFGGLLHRLNHAVQAAIDPTAAGRYATSHRGELRDGAWALRTWPALLSPIPGVDEGPASPPAAPSGPPYVDRGPSRGPT